MTCSLTSFAFFESASRIAEQIKPVTTKDRKKLLIGLNEKKKFFSIIIPHHLNLFSYSSNKPVSSTCNQTLETKD